jgi:Carboxypeptidase regulatory-like domain
MKTILRNMSQIFSIFTQSCRLSALFIGSLIAILFANHAAFAQVASQPVLPAVGSSCVASVLNRNANLDPDFGYTIFNVPSTQGIMKIRVTCSDGTVGQSKYVFPVAGDATYTGDIMFGQLDPVPFAMSLTSPIKKLNAGQAVQLTNTALREEGGTWDATTQEKGTFYRSSSNVLAEVGIDGQVTVNALFAPSSSARVVMTSWNEGVSATTMLVLGPRGKVTGKVVQADGVTPVSNAQVTILRHQPYENVASVTTDAAGAFNVDEVNAGVFSLYAIDVATGDRARGISKIENEGDNPTVTLQMNGQGTVTVQVVDANNAPVPNASVWITSMTAFSQSRSATADAAGRFSFPRLPAGDFIVVTRDEVKNLVGAAVGFLPVNGDIVTTVRLQSIGTIAGTVYGTDGVTVQEGIQVRLISATRGIMTQAVTGADGKYLFEPLPLSDGPYILDAIQDGRLRARVQGVNLTAPDQVFTQDIRLGQTGSVTGKVSNSAGAGVAGVKVSVQSTSGLRLSFSANTDSTGKYFIDGVPVGSFQVSAADGARTANAAGQVQTDGERVTLNLNLAANGIVGTVYSPNGTSPVASGVSVKLFAAARGSPIGIALAETTTNALGAYSLALDRPGDYYVQASDGQGNRGFTLLTQVIIEAGKVIVADIRYLGRGAVFGTVVDSAGTPQTDLDVKLFTQNPFIKEYSIKTNSSGNYEIPSVFVGPFTLTVKNDATKLGAYGSGALINDGDRARVDMRLDATGTVTGVVVKSDGITPVAKAEMKLQLAGNKAEAPVIAVADAAGRFTFSGVPLTGFTLVAVEPITGDVGVVSDQLVLRDEVKNLTVKLIGQGAVRVTVKDGTGALVKDATVKVESLVRIPGIPSTSISVNTDAQGVALVQPILNGDFKVTVEKKLTPTKVLGGSGAGTIVSGATVEVPISLTPLGRITGKVYMPNGVDLWVNTKLKRVYVKLGDQQVILGTDSSFAFDNVLAGSYTLEAWYQTRLQEKDATGREVPFANDLKRALSAGITITTQGETATKDLSLFAIGSVSGKVTNPNGSPASPVGSPLINYQLSISNPDPVFGRSAQVTVGDDGTYFVVDMPAGDFTLRVTNGSAALTAEGKGRVRFEGDNVVIDLTLVDSAIQMPRAIFDANNFKFDIRGDGSIISGTNGNFSGDNIADTRGMRLEIVKDGIAIPFTNGDGSIGRLTKNQQQIEVDEVNLATGLYVNRKVYVPKNGYFARYLETFENRTTAPITFKARVVTNYSESRNNPRVVDSSDGDTVLSTLDNTSPDRWVSVDDDKDGDPFDGPASGSIPVISQVFDGAGARDRADAKFELVGVIGKLSLNWGTVTLQPGEKTSYLHFVAPQLNRLVARTAAERLAQLPVEALDLMLPEERALVRNFAINDDTGKLVAPLPSINTATISGKVLSGDGVTTIAGSQIGMQNVHPLFGRKYYTSSKFDGTYAYVANTTGAGNSIAIPLADFQIWAVHPDTSVKSTTPRAEFALDQVLSTQDLIFNNTGNLRGSVKYSNGQLITAGQVRILLNGNWLSKEVDAAGSYLFTGIPAKDYFIQAFAKDVALAGSGRAAVPSARTTVANITLEPSGEITGLVKKANGEPAVGATVVLGVSGTKYDANGFQLGYNVTPTLTDTAGRYRFADLTVGPVSVSVSDQSTGFGAYGNAQIVAGQVANLDLNLAGVGILNIQVNFARGGGAPKAGVVGGLSNASTDTYGAATLRIPLGKSNISIYHPDSGVKTDREVQISAVGEVATLTVTLPASGGVRGTVYRSGGILPAAGIPVSISSTTGRGSSGATTDQQGNYRIVGLPLGEYYATAIDYPNLRFADELTVVTGDGVETTRDLVLEDNRIPLPTGLSDTNGFGYGIERNAVSTGGSAFSELGRLSLNGTEFTGDTSAYVEGGRRQMVVTQPSDIGGITVTRKVYVPRIGYFVRTIDLFENKTNAPITINPKLVSTTPRALHSTSKGNAVLQTGANGDTWATFASESDDDPLAGIFDPKFTFAKAAFVFGQNGATKSADILTAGINGGELVTGWNNISIPPGGKVGLMHFAAQQVHRAGAQASAQRLVQLPPEALMFITPEDAAAILNFNVPANLNSNVPPLPSLQGNVSGRVLEGDRKTGVTGARMRVQSTHPLFGRLWAGGIFNPFRPECQTDTSIRTLVTGTDGIFSLASSSTNGRPIPVDFPVNIWVKEFNCDQEYDTFGHPQSGLQSQIGSAVFNIDGQATGDTIFDSGILVGTVSGPADFGVSGGRVSVDIKPLMSRSLAGINNTGSYYHGGLPPDTFTITATTSHSQGTGLTGTRTGAQVLLGQTIVTDVFLQPVGTITGAVLTPNGEAGVGSKVRIEGANSFVRQTEVDSLGRYQLFAVPVGTYKVILLDDRNQARTFSEVTVTENQLSVKNFTLIGVGVVNLTVTMPNGAPAPDALAYLTATAVGQEQLVGRTEPDGKLVITVPIGNYQLRITDPRLPYESKAYRTITGSIAANGEIQNQAARLLAIRAGQLTVVDHDNSDAPLADVQISLSVGTGPAQSVGKTSATGELTIPVMFEGDYTVKVDKTLEGTLVSKVLSGTILATENGVALALRAELSRQLGSLRVTVRDADSNSTPLANVPISISDNGAPRRNIGNTGADGSLLISGVAVGPYTVYADIVSGNAAAQISAQGTLTQALIGQTQSILVEKKDSPINLPVIRSDANNFSYNIEHGGDSTSTNYSSLPSLWLDDQMFTGAPIGLQQLNNRQLVIKQDTPISGLTVSRKVFVPQNGYFARYLEIVENRTSSPITAKVAVKLAEGAYIGNNSESSQIVTTSSGDTSLQASGPNKDNWLVFGPTRSIILSNPQGAITADSITFGSVSRPNIVATWSNLSVPPGGKVVLMHFVVQQINNAGAIASATRLTQLPPEALQGLSVDEIGATVNFALPTNGFSTLPALPALDGRVSGRVFEGDNITLTPNTYINIGSQHPLFNREWRIQADADGAYSITGKLEEGLRSIALPIDTPVTIKAAHPITKLPITDLVVAFPQNSNLISQDIIFPSGLISGVLSGGFQISAVGNLVEAYDSLGRLKSFATTGVGGAYQLTGLAAGNYSLLATIRTNIEPPYVGGAGLTSNAQLVRVPSVDVIKGQATTQNLQIEPTGGVTGQIVDANGAAISRWNVYLEGTGFRYSVATDTSGRFVFNGVPIGISKISAVERVNSQVVNGGNITVNENQVTSKDLAFLGTGVVSITVNFARGIPAPGAFVTITSPNLLGRSTYTNTNGQLSANIPVGDYQLTVSHQDGGSIPTIYNGSVSTIGQTTSVTLSLNPRAKVGITVRKDSITGDPISGAVVSLQCCSTIGQLTQYTDASGRVIYPLDVGTHQISVRTLDGQSTTLTVQIDASLDGQLIEKNAFISTVLDKSGKLAFNGERHLYSISANAGDIISVRIAGQQLDVIAPIQYVDAKLISPSKAVLAAGYGTGPNSGYSQQNYVGDLNRIVAPVAGYYAISIRPYTSGYFGGYRLEVLLNGIPVNISSYVGGGKVSGVTQAPDGSAITQIQTVEISSANQDTLALRIRAKTDSNGMYQFDGVPIGAYSVSVIDDTTGLPIATTNGAIDTADQQVTTNVQLPSIRGSVKYASGSIVRNTYVSVYRADGTYLDSAYTGNLGKYEFYNLPVGADLKIKVSDPRNYVVTQASITLLAGQVSVVDLQLKGVGTITGTVTQTNGTPYVGGYVYATYITDETLGYKSYLNSRLDSNGGYILQNVPVGSAIPIEFQGIGFDRALPVVVQLSNDGEVKSVPLVIEGLSGGGALRMSLIVGGQAYPGQCSFYVNVTAPSGQIMGATFRGSCGGTLAQGVPVGSAVVTVDDDNDNGYGPVTTIVVAGQEVSVPIQVSKIVGTVKFADGAPVIYPSVHIRSDSGQTYYAQDVNYLGEYAVYGVPTGGYSIEGQDNYSSLKSTVEGTLTDFNTPAVADIVLPTSGTVQGVFKDGNNSPVANTYLYVRSSNLDVDRYVYTDQNGAYLLTKVATGVITVQGQNPITGLISTASGNLAVGQTLVLDLIPPTTGSLSGRVLAADGVTTVSGINVAVSTTTVYGPYGTFNYFTSSDASGLFSVPDFPAGPVQVTAEDSSGNVGKATGNIVASNNTTLDVRLGTAVNLPIALNGSGTTVYNVQCDGDLNDDPSGESSGTYDGTYFLTVAGYSFPCVSVANRYLNNEINIGPYTMGGLTVNRRVYVPPVGGYARYFDTITNPSASEITVPVRVHGNLGSNEFTRFGVTPSDTGNRYAVTIDNGVKPALGHVFSGVNPSVVPTPKFTPPNDNISYSWSINIPANSSASLLHFTIQRPSSDVVATQSQAEALANMTQPGMFDGLSTSDKASIKNFVVTP